jgi:hypothetical protein
MKQRRAGVIARNGIRLLFAVGCVGTVACESPTRPLPRLPNEAALLQAQAGVTMRRVADLADTRVWQLQGLTTEQLNRKLTQAIARLPAKDRELKVAFFGAESFDAFEREMFVVRRFAGDQYGALMRQVQREQANAIKVLLAAEPSWEIMFECEVASSLNVNAGCEGEGNGWEGDSESPYCLKETAAYSGAYVATLAAVRAYAQAPSDKTLNAVLFTTAAWFYAADVLSACIDREFN